MGPSGPTTTERGQARLLVGEGKLLSLKPVEIYESGDPEELKH